MDPLVPLSQRRRLVVLHRRTAVSVAVALLVLGSISTAPARAAGMAAFRLTNVDQAGASPVREALALVLPTGSVVPRDVEQDPPTILPDSTGYISYGFDPTALEVSLGDGQLEKADGTFQPFQAIKLDFGPEGLTAGGKLFFQLKWSETYNPDTSGLIRLVLPVDVTNLAIETIELPKDYPTGPTNGVGTGGTPTGGEVPEPATLALWSLAAAGLGAWRASRKRS